MLICIKFTQFIKIEDNNVLCTKLIKSSFLLTSLIIFKLHRTFKLFKFTLNNP